MNPDMAECAVLILGIGHVVGCRLQGNAVALESEIARPVVTFQTQRERLGTLQQACVHRAVRHVAGLAAVDPCSGVFKGKGSAFINMALQASLFI